MGILFFSTDQLNGMNITVVCIPSIPFLISDTENRILGATSIRQAASRLTIAWLSCIASNNKKLLEILVQATDRVKSSKRPLKPPILEIQKANCSIHKKLDKLKPRGLVERANGASYRINTPRSRHCPPWSRPSGKLNPVSTSAHFSTGTGCSQFNRS